jgi:RNA polymerase sigma-70 factor (ECF subfamily)
MDVEPMDELYRRYFPLVREKCRRMLADPSDAQDVAQETMMRLWKSDVKRLPPAQLICWLYRTSTHLAIDALRRDSRRSFEAVPDVASPERLDERLHHRRLLASVARRLPSQELEVALLHRVDGLGQQELAEVLGISERTVRRLLAKVDARLERLRQEG